jgi:hypothetical protein
MLSSIARLETFSGGAMMSVSNDKRIIKLDFVAECGDLLVTAGAAIAAAASAERIDVLEMALRQARVILLDGIAEFKALTQLGSERND